ncbi:hypothetical protein [Achromobacter sp. Root565]|uniref:hypothetical protein n=1 Tax=Achromobacter sp. Root565 TaxID=1736564 RepID=UPI0006F42C8B|nr:hypothetical protein [Achromobacter sp. Root565]KQZ96164.1 hypothetical protein ASD71_26245 [Achromobacter sp. Root565]
MSKTILSRLVENGGSIEALRQAASHPTLSHVIGLILDSDRIATQAAKPWEYKLVSEFVDESFVLRSSPWWASSKEWTDRLSSEYAQQYSYLATVALTGEGLDFFICEEDGGFRLAGAGDVDFDFLYRLFIEDKTSISDYNVSAPPTWSRNLFVNHRNWRAYSAVWNSSIENTEEGRQVKEWKAQAIRFLSYGESDIPRPGEVHFSQPESITVPRPDARLIAAVVATQQRFWANWTEDMVRPKSRDEIIPWILENFPGFSGADAAAVDRVACVIDRDPSTKKRP